MEVQQIPVVGDRASAVPRLRGVVLVRALWLLVSVTSAGLFLASLPPYFSRTLRIEESGPFIQLTGAQLREGLAAVGLSPQAYTVLGLAWLVLLAGGFWIVGALLWWRGPDDRGAIVVSLVLVVFGSTFPNTLYALQDVHPAAALAGKVLGTLAFAAFPLLLFVFPDGRFVPGWTRWVALLFVVDIAVAEHLPDSWWNHRPSWLAIPVFSVLAGSLLYAPVHRYRRVSGPVERQQTKWVVLGLGTAIGTFLGLGALAALAPSQLSTPAGAVAFELVAGPVLVLAMLAVPVTIGIAVLRHRLYDIDLVLNRALVYVTLTGLLLGLYLAAVAVAGALLPIDDPAAALPAAAVVAALFAPLRDRLQRLVNRLIYGDRDDPYGALARLGMRLDATGEPEAVLAAVAETVASALKLPSATVVLGEPAAPALVAAWGVPRGEPVVLALVHRNEPVGELRLSLRPGERAFSAADRRLLDDLALRAGAAAHAVLLAVELRSARQRLVSAREEERRRLRRDLHDGLGPQLSGQALTIDAVRTLLRRDPDAAEGLLVDLKDQVRHGVGEVRRLVHGLRPPALDDLGLLGALRETAARQSAGDLRVTVHAPPELPPLPAAVEVAAYRIAQEALTNVVRHAGATTCEITLSLTAQPALAVEVTDDGRGICPDRGRGVGLSSMRERAVELGGRLDVEPVAGGGTAVRAVLPLPGEQ